MPSVPSPVKTAGDIHIQNRTQTAPPLQCYCSSFAWSAKTAFMIEVINPALISRTILWFTFLFLSCILLRVLDHEQRPRVSFTVCFSACSCLAGNARHSCHNLVKDEALRLILPPDSDQLPSVIYGDSRVETTLFFIFLQKLDYYRYKL